MDFNKLFSLEGKVALVTGAAYGIGFAIAEAYAKAGAKIAFNCRSQHHMDQALADYRAKGIEAKGYICDVTDEEQVKNMVADIEKELGVIDILVNNAGIIKRIPMTEMSVDDFRHAARPTARPADRSVPLVIRHPDTPQAMIKRGDTFTTRFLKLFTVKKFFVTAPVKTARIQIRIMIALFDRNFFISNDFCIIMSPSYSNLVASAMIFS